MIQAGDDQIVLTVCEIRGDKIRLGLEAPQHVRIQREEILLADQKKEAEAAQDVPSNSV